jgi:hypothetical protein
MDQPQSDIKFFSLNVTRDRCLKLGESVAMSSDSRRAQHRLLTRLMERSRLKTKQLLAQQPPTPNSRRRSLTSARGSNAAIQPSLASIMGRRLQFSAKAYTFASGEINIL